MLTGDNRTSAAAVAGRLGISEVEAEVLPEETPHRRAAARRGPRGRHGRRRLNDAPALAAADVGIAMGTGTDVAIQSAGITLVKGDLAGIVRARALSRATMRNIRQNLALAFVYNAVGIPIAAGVLYPWCGLLLSPIVAALAMSLSSVSVIGQRAAVAAASIRYRGNRLKEGRPGLRPGPHQGALPLGTPPRAAALGTRPLVGLREGWPMGPNARRSPAFGPIGIPPPSTRPKNEVQRPLPLVGVQGATPPGGVQGQSPGLASLRGVHRGEVAAHAFRIWCDAGEQAERLNRLEHRHAAAVQCAAAECPRGAQQLGLHREVDDLGDPQ